MKPRAVAAVIRETGMDPRDAAHAMVNALARDRGYRPPWADAIGVDVPTLASVDDISEVHQALLGGQDGKRGALGSYYTPEPLAQFTTRFTLDAAMSERHPLDVIACDPSCGAGAFLVQAARQLTRRYLDVEFGRTTAPEWMTRAATVLVVSECVFGIDIDLVAVDLAKSALWLECGGVPPIEFLDDNIICGDPLSGAEPPRLVQRRPKQEAA